MLRAFGLCVRWGLALLPLAALGCREPGADRIVGPDGSPMAHVHCRGAQGECFRIAGQLCPMGYEIRPVFSASDGNFLVRCRAGGTATVAVQASCPAPAARATAALVATPDASSGWPPSGEPWPTAYPWPPPEVGSNAHPGEPLPPTPMTAKGQVDVGY